MGILDEDIVRVRDSTDLVAIISQHLQLKRVGQRWMGLCPFHNEKSPSLSVNPELGVYYCFGCQAKGDSITFVREVQHLDFVGAVEYLADKAGITLRYDSTIQTEGRRKRGRLVEAMEAAVAWYHQRLLSAPDAAAARSYLRGRGIDGDVVRQYRIGWAPDDWDVLVKALDVPFDDLKGAGLAIVNKAGRRQDVFRARVLFPIFDAQGDPVALGGRVLPGGDGPKYRNSSETPIYAKSKVLYGLNWAKGNIVAHDPPEAIVCEGYTDVIGMAQAGMPRAVAPCGTALTEEHVRILTRFGKRLVLAFDADAAGENAAARFYAWEDKYEVDVWVADLPPGEDPGDLAQSDPDRLRAAVDGAKPFLRFRYERALVGADTSSPEGKARAADKVLPVIAEHPNPLVRDEYLMELAGELRLEVDLLRLRLKPSARGVQVVEAVPVAPTRTAASGREVTALRLLIHRRDEVREQLDPVLFADPVAGEVFAALLASPSVPDAIAAVGPEGEELLYRLANEDPSDGPTAVDVALLVKDALQRLAAEARATGDLVLHHEVRGLVDRLQPPDVDADAVGEALALLRAQHGVVAA